MPTLVIDEVILIVDAYFQLKNCTDNKVRIEYLTDLSKRLKKLAFFPELVENPYFRNITGMKLLIQTVSQLESGNQKLHNPSKTQRRVFEYYQDKTEILHGIAIGISDIGAEKILNLQDYNDFIGGSILMSKHIELERTDKTIYNVRNSLYQRKVTTCYCCHTDLEEIYGDNASELMEVHYAYPLYQYRRNHETLSSYVIPVCPICHKLAHSEVLTFEEDELMRKLTKGVHRHV